MPAPRHRSSTIHTAGKGSFTGPTWAQRNKGVEHKSDL